MFLTSTLIKYYYYKYDGDVDDDDDDDDGGGAKISTDRSGLMRTGITMEL